MLNAIQKYRPFLYIIAAIFVAIGIDFLIQNNSDNEFRTKEYVYQLETQYDTVFEGIRDNLQPIIDAEGIEGVLNVVEYAFVNDKIGMYYCHVLMHTIGHEAVAYYDSNYSDVLSHNSKLCETGYRHGAEAQIVLYGGDYIVEAQKFCTELKSKEPAAQCFHGAGHAFMNETKDVLTSLELCDGLQNDYSESVTPCYNAVFAELTNLVGGSDGSTGVPYTNGPQLTLEDKTPIEYCSGFGEQYRYQCIFELSGLGIGLSSNPAYIEQRLKQCTDGDYVLELKGGCIKSVSAVGAQHELATNNSVTFPPHILELSEFLRRSYIMGVGVEMQQYRNSGATRDWVGFCSNFNADSDLQLCASIFGGSVDELL